MFSLICERRCMSDWILKLLLMSWDVQIQGLTTDLCIIWLKIDFHIISRWTLDWSSSSALLDYPHIIFFLEKSLKSDYQDLLRSVCFQKIYFHCSSLGGGMIFSSLRNISHLLRNVSLIQHRIVFRDVMHSLFQRGGGGGSCDTQRPQ